MLTVGIFVFVEVEVLDFSGPFELPKVLIVAGARWIDERDVVTSSGISAGIDMSLHHLVRRLAGAELAAATARQMDYRWQHSGGAAQQGVAVDGALPRC